jgi:hypothetical protein
VTDGSYTDRFSAVSQLIEDSIRANSEGVQAAEFSPKRIAGEWVTLE